MSVLGMQEKASAAASSDVGERKENGREKERKERKKESERGRERKNSKEKA